VLVTHHVEEIIPEIERVVLLHRGGIFADGPKAGILTAQTLSSLFAVPVQVTADDGIYRAW